jgi:hypothetical protein
MVHLKVLALATTFTLISLCTNQANALFGPSNYSECVLDNLNFSVSPEAAVFIQSECRQAFPQPSTSFFTPDSMQQCYEKHKNLASSRAVAKAIYEACNDYNYRPSQIPTSR